MLTNTQTKIQLDNLVHLSSFAQYLLDSKLKEFAAAQLAISRELDVPMLRHFDKLTEEEMLEIGLAGARRMLEALANNRGADYIRFTIEQYSSNQMPVVAQEEVVAEDINLVIHSRKRSFLQFLPSYTNDVVQLTEILRELEIFLLELQNKATNMYLQLLKKRIHDQAHFTQKVTDTSPGFIYVIDLEYNSYIYTNRPPSLWLGYRHANGEADKDAKYYIHPDDVPLLRKFNLEFSNTKDAEIRSIRYRMRNEAGDYVWVRSFETVFKRNEQGKVVEKIGIAINVHEQKVMSEKLKNREEELLEAQEIAKIGSFTWDINGQNSQGSPQTFAILEVNMNDQDAFFRRVHKDDVEKMKEALEKSMETGNYEFEFRYHGNKKDKIIWVRGVVHYKDGRPDFLNGTVMDITEKQTLIQQLSHQQNLYKRVEELANMGNWSWDLQTGKLEWTDHLYRMYGLDPQSEDITLEKFLSFVHPDDLAAVKAGTDNIFNETNVDQTFRIVTRFGKEKIIRSIAQVERNEKGEPVRVIGTERDVTEKNSMVESLRESEKLYRQAQALANIGNWTWEVDTDKVEWSEELFRIYGINPGEKITSERVASFIHPDEREEVLRYLDECIRTGKNYDKQHRIILPNGQEKVIQRRAEIIKEPGKPVKMVGTTQDITQIYKVQQELRENQNFIRKITDATPSIITTYNVNSGEYVFISEGLEKLLGYQVNDAMEQGIDFFARLIHPEDLQEVMDRNTSALADANAHSEIKDVIVEFNYRMKNAAGEYRWFHTYGTIFDRNAQGQVEHVLNISLDITEQKIAIQKIKEQEHFIQQIADASPTILYLYDVEKQSIVYINREIFFVLGYHPDEVIESGDKVTSLLYHPEDFQLLPARKESMKNFSQVDSMIQYECRIRSKENEYRWFLVREIVFNTDKNGNICQILGAALDINRRKEMEKTILQNTLLLEQSNSSLEEFAYVASHDLKEPLRKISTFGDRLAASQLETLSPEGKIYLNKIQDASTRMQTMISDLLSISMITGNRSFEKYSLKKILDETIQTLEYKIENQNAVIRHDGLPETRMIPSQFRQLFQNLLSNSLKFVRPGVQPVISISHHFLKEKDIVHYQLSPADEYLKIVFRDNGIGFEKEFAGKIFAIFQRLHGRSEYEGSGIGLAICKKIVEHHGGIIYAESNPEEGATFTIILPV